MAINGCLRAAGARLLEQLVPVLARHLDVRQQDLRTLGDHAFTGFGRGAGGRHGGACRLQDRPEQVSCIGFVVHDQHADAVEPRPALARV